MTCVRIVSGYICHGRVYRYKGYFFEWHNYLGPVPLKKNGDPRANIPAGFWDAIDSFSALGEEERSRYLEA